MPLGVNNIELLRYFRQPEGTFGKSVQREWLFWGFFMFNPFAAATRAAAAPGSILKSSILKTVNAEFPPVIQPFHILSVTIPTYQFEKIVMMYGQVPRSFPVLNFKGLDLQIELEEDEKGTVDYFVNWNQRNIIDSDGYYKAPNSMKLDAFVLEIQDKMGVPVVYHTFHDIYFLNASEQTYSYAGGGTIKRQLTFGCDRMSTIYIKQNAVAAATEAVVGLATAGLGGNELTGRFK